MGFVAAVLVVGLTLSACAAKGTAPSDAPASPGSQTLAPTEKSLDPTGPNKFTPTAKAKPAPTALPGNVRGGN